MRIGNLKDNETLFERLNAIFQMGETQNRKITTPGPNAPGVSMIYWLKTPGIWARLSRTRDKSGFICLFGSALPENRDSTITMDVQINLGARRLGAALVDTDGQLFLGHLGELRGGRANVSRAEFRKRIKEFAPTDVMSEHESKSYFVLGPISDDNFIFQLTRYVRECFRIRQEVRGLSAEEADDDQQPEDELKALERRNISIKLRRGQQGFRRKLFESYQGQCVISGCAVADVLEAAHLKPYAGTQTNVMNNGILLRADLHTLLDCHLLAIHPKTRRVKFAKTVKSSPTYKDFEGTRIKEPLQHSDRPSEFNLQALFENLIK